jgi:hypothetical protein
VRRHAAWKLGRPFKWMFSGSLRAMLDMTPKKGLPPASPVDRPQVFPAQGTRRARVSILNGCVQTILDPKINEATIRLLQRHGVEWLWPAVPGAAAPPPSIWGWRGTPCLGLAPQPQTQPAALAAVRLLAGHSGPTRRGGLAVVVRGNYASGKGAICSIIHASNLSPAAVRRRPKTLAFVNARSIAMQAASFAERMGSTLRREGTTCWPVPESTDNMNTKFVGRLGLSDEEEDALVSFMQTLTDGFMQR